MSLSEDKLNKTHLFSENNCYEHVSKQNDWEILPTLELVSKIRLPVFWPVSANWQTGLFITIDSSKLALNDNYKIYNAQL